MDSLRLASSMGVGVGMDLVSGAMSGALEKASAHASAISDGVSSATSKAASLTVADTAGALTAGASKLKECTGTSLSSAAQTAMATTDALKSSAIAGAGTAMSTMSDPRAVLSSIGSWSERQEGDDRGSRGATGADEEDSQSGGEEQASTRPGLGMLLGAGVASRLGLAAGRVAEKEQLVPKDKEPDLEVAKRASFGGLSTLGGLGSNLGTLGSSVGSAIGLSAAKPKEPDGVARLCNCCPALTSQQRMMGFGICFGLGVLLSLSALSSIGSIFRGNPTPFAVKYTLGNLLSIGSSSFLVGPAQQCRDMLTPERRIASLVYVCTLAGTLVSVFVVKIQMLSLVCVVAQFSALTWYMLSYIPYGQQCARRVLRRFV